MNEIFQIQWKENQNGQWDTAANPDNDNHWDTLKEAEEFMSSLQNQYPMSEFKIVPYSSSEWIDN
jgi:hypothetical protein